MAGYSKIFCIGESGGFMGADGINPIYFQILVGDADRQWYEVHYFNKKIKPIGQITAIIPEAPNHPNALIDACIVFFPSKFSSCPSLKQIEHKLADTQRLNFHSGNIPQEWPQLREEAFPVFQKLNIFVADIKSIDLSSYGVS